MLQLQFNSNIGQIVAGSGLPFFANIVNDANDMVQNFFKFLIQGIQVLHNILCTITTPGKWSPLYMYKLQEKLNITLFRINVTEMAGRNLSWSRGQNLHWSQSLHNLMRESENEPEPQPQLPQITSQSQTALRTSSEEEGLKLLDSATEGAASASNYEEVDTSLLDYDSDPPTSEQTVVQAQKPTAMYTDPGVLLPTPNEMDATYFQCRSTFVKS